MEHFDLNVEPNKSTVNSESHLTAVTLVKMKKSVISIKNNFTLKATFLQAKTVTF